jgi:hypothetical protein
LLELNLGLNLALIALSLSGRFAAPSSPFGYYHEEKAT